MSSRPKLFQYWDDPQPPTEVAQWIGGFASSNEEYEHVLFNEQSAERFIAAHFGPREKMAFRACAMPAMQADYVRLCAIIVHAGVYVDADNQCLRPLASLVDPIPHALMLTWTGLINNAFMMFRQPRNPFLVACLELATDNIEHRRFKVENTSTGPGVVNAVRAVVDPSAIPEMWAAYDNVLCRTWGFMELIELAKSLIEPTPELCQSYRDISLMHTMAASTWIGSIQPSYKQTERHWINWTADIYRDA